jgi:hypothetical protein
MPILYQKIISRDDLIKNRNVLYLFGDNDARLGFGGQAKAMRNEPNGIGIRTKTYPDWEEQSFWSDDTIEENYHKIIEDLQPVYKHLSTGGIVVVPTDGIGTDKAKMSDYCPKTFSILCYLLDNLEE